MITIKEIAQEAGVSTMMVSRVVNKKYNLVSEANIKKIEALLEKYHYIPNSSARSLSSKRARIIAVFIQGCGNELIPPYNAVMLGYILREVQQRGYDTMVRFIVRYDDIIENLRTWNVSGAVFFGAFTENINKLKEDTDIPLIFTDCYSDRRQLINVGIDDYGGGCLAASHFLAYGHTEFAFCCDSLSESPVLTRRYHGFSDTLAQSGFLPSESHIIDAHTVNETADRLISLRRKHLAVFVFSDNRASLLLNRLNELGFCVPDDFSLIGFDNLPVSTLCRPPLTTIGQDIEKKAVTAVSLLFQYMEDKSLPVQNITLDVSLISRESVKNFHLCDEKADLDLTSSVTAAPPALYHSETNSSK